MTFEEYKAIPALNATAIKAGGLSMLHMHAAMTGVEKEQTPAMRWGKIVHKAILEREAFFKTVSVFEGSVRRGQAWDQFQADHDPEWILTTDQHAKLFALSAAVHANADAHRLIESSMHEVTAQWAGDEYGPAKARLDGFSERAGVVELKTARAINQRMFAKAFAGSGYDIQCGWYCEGANRASLCKTFPACNVIAIESKPPFDVAVYTISNTTLQVGLARAKKIAARYRDAERAGVFPGVSAGVTELVMPDWYGGEEVSEMFAEMADDVFGGKE
jgi:hypothetical protein